MKEQKTSYMSALDTCCHVCGDSALDMVPGYELLRGVTSDCKPWLRGNRLCVCRSCGCVQKMADDMWKSEVDRIYQAYSIYHQSDGAEQTVFDEFSGKPSARSERLLQHLRTAVELPKKGRLLDVGCGNGALLGAFNRLSPLWSLAGTELNDKYRPVIESIDNVKALYTCPPDQVPGTYTLITMIHVLEHVLGPKEFIARLKDKLEDGGLLVVEVPEFLQNPFDLLIVDHCTHFTVATAAELIQNAGYEVLLVTTNWVPKELTIVARKVGYGQTNRADHASSLSFESAVQCLEWLKSVVVAARQISAEDTFGLFGTSIAATWLFSELESTVSFFVDEDPNRAGKTHVGLPILHPRDVPSDSRVFIALPTKLARNIKTRMLDLKYGFDCYLPPPLPT